MLKKKDFSIKLALQLPENICKLIAFISLDLKTSLHRLLDYIVIEHM